MEAITSNPSSPINGENLINRTSPDAKEEKRSKSLSPKKLYELFFESKLKVEDLQGLGYGEPSEFLPTVIGYIQRLIDGATRRATTHKRNVGAFRQVLANRHNLGLTQPQVNSYRAKIQQQQASLLKCRKSLDLLQEQHNLVVDSFKRRYVQEIKASREDAYAERMAASKTKRTLELLTSASQNGEAAIVKALTESVQGPRDEFREKLVSLLRVLDISLSDEFSKRPKLLTQVVGRVAEHYQENGQ